MTTTTWKQKRYDGRVTERITSFDDEAFGHLAPARPSEMACGWCKGFVHEEWQDSMRRYVHDETPVTKHEVLPFRPGR